MIHLVVSAVPVAVICYHEDWSEGTAEGMEDVLGLPASPKLDPIAQVWQA